MDMVDGEKMTNEIEKMLKVFFAGRNEFDLAFLMGSQLTGRARKESDVDVVVLFAHSPSPEEVIFLKVELEKLLKKDVDLVVLNVAGPIIGRQALKTGILLFSKRKSYEQFFVRNVNEYDDLKYYRREIEKNIMGGRIYA